jgi:hypothetical protein
MNEIALKISQCREDAEHQPAGCGGGIYVTRQNLEAHAPRLQITDQGDDMGKRAAYPGGCFSQAGFYMGKYAIK